MKIKREDYKNIWFTSDWHLGHDRGFILNPRGFDNIKDHNEYLVETFNKMVDEKNDIVFHLGDFSFESSKLCNDSLHALKCDNIHFITGNHDKSLLNALKGHVMSKGLGQYHELSVTDKIKKQDITLCHYPMLAWNKSHHGAWNLCGHSHGSNPDSLPKNKLGKCLDVGVEVGLTYNPTFMFNFEDIRDIMSRKEVRGHH